jgi:PPOX class probable F420-dependent enzyme
MMAVPIPESFRDLFEKPVFVTLVTVLPNGQPHATPVWVDFDGTNVVINTARGRQKDKDMQRNAKVTVLAIDPANPYRWIEVRGQIAEETEEGALDHINKLSLKYRGDPDYYAPYPQRRGQEQRVIYKIQPTKITTSAR